MNIDVAGYAFQLRASNIGHCLRRFAYLAASPPSNNPLLTPPNPRFLDGHWHEFDVKQRLDGSTGEITNVVFGAGLQHEPEVLVDLGFGKLTGHLDGLVEVFDHPLKVRKTSVPPGQYILEVKSMSSGPWWKFVKEGYRQAFPEYFDQAQAYLHSTRLKFYTILDRIGDPGIRALYVSLPPHEVSDEPPWELPNEVLVVAKNKESGELAVEVIKKDDGHMDALMRRHIEAWKAVQANELPDRLHDSPDNYECRGCPFLDECWDAANTPTASMRTTASQEVMKAAEDYVYGRGLKRSGEDLMEEVKPILEEALNDGPLQLGEIKIVRGKRVTKSYDNEVLRSLLPADKLASAVVQKESYTLNVRGPKDANAEA